MYFISKLDPKPAPASTPKGADLITLHTASNSTLRAPVIRVIASMLFSADAGREGAARIDFVSVLINDGDAENLFATIPISGICTVERIHTVATAIAAVRTRIAPSLTGNRSAPVRLEIASTTSAATQKQAPINTARLLPIKIRRPEATDMMALWL